MVPRERLAAFLFRLARDELAFGCIEEHVKCVETYHTDPAEVVKYEGVAMPMGEWAREVAARLVPDEPLAPAPVPMPPVASDTQTGADLTGRAAYEASE